MDEDEEKEVLYKMAEMIAAYTNPHLFFDLKDIPEVERLAELQDMKNKMLELIS